MTNSDEEESEGGSRIQRHSARDREYAMPDPDSSVADEVTLHFEQHGVSSETVFHEILSELVHLDVHISPATKARPIITLFTTGMSDLPMMTPEGAEAYARAELMLCLPADWDLRQESLEREENYWPIRLLKTLARLPHAYQSWLGPWHTVPNGDPVQPYAEGTDLCGAFVAPPRTIPEQALTLESTQGPVQIYAVIPIHESEMNAKLEQGAEFLYDKLGASGISERLDPKRRSVIRRKRFWLF